MSIRSTLRIAIVAIAVLVGSTLVSTSPSGATLSYVEFPPLVGAAGCAITINDDGLVFGSAITRAGTPDQDLYAWTASGGLVDIEPAADSYFKAAGGDRLVYTNGPDWYMWRPSTGSVLLVLPIEFEVFGMVGHYLGGFRQISGQLHAAIWDLDLGAYLPIPETSSLNRWLVALNSRGEAILRGTTAAGRYRSFFWKPGSRAVGMGNIYGAGTSVEALDLNDSGVAVGTATLSNGESRAFMWTKATGMTNLGPANTPAAAGSINNHGTVLGQTKSGDAFVAFISSARRGLVTIPGYTLGLRINDHDQVLLEKGSDRVLWDPVVGEVHNFGAVSEVRTVNNSGQAAGCSLLGNAGAAWSFETNVEVHWSAAELARLDQLRAFYGYADNASLAKFGVYVLAYINGSDPVTAPTPVTIGEPGSDGSTLITWEPNEIDLLNDAKWRWQLNDEDIHRWGYMVLSFIANLQGA